MAAETGDGGAQTTVSAAADTPDAPSAPVSNDNPSADPVKAGTASSSSVKNGFPDTALPSTTSVSSVSNWPVVLLTLLGIVAMILCLAWAARRFGGLSAMGIRNMRVVAAIPVGNREKVALIDVNGKQFLIGVTPQHISHLHSFEDAVITNEDTRKSEFADKLQSLLKKRPITAGDTVADKAGQGD